LKIYASGAANWELYARNTGGQMYIIQPHASEYSKLNVDNLFMKRSRKR